MKTAVGRVKTVILTSITQDSNVCEDNRMQYLSEETSDLTEQEEQGIYLGKQPTFHPPCNLLSNTTSTNVEEPLPLLDFGLTTFGGEYTPTETLAGPTTTAFPSDREETSGPVNEVAVVQTNDFIGAR